MPSDKREPIRAMREAAARAACEADGDDWDREGPGVLMEAWAQVSDAALIAGLRALLVHKDFCFAKANSWGDWEAQPIAGQRTFADLAAAIEAQSQEPTP